ncbi:MAG: DNA alkylation repair protein [Ignavibacteriales bacterium]|nr:DNA alkylation repair protein [Ignavibacteriales bacterium]
MAKQFKELLLTEIQELLNSQVHEERLIGLFILVEQYRKADEMKRQTIYEFYLKNAKRVNNWDLVDLSAEKIIGAYLLIKTSKSCSSLPNQKNLMGKTNCHHAFNFFILSEMVFMTRRLEIADVLLTDEHDLIHKAVGWMLREIGNRNLAEEVKFLKKRYKTNAKNNAAVLKSSRTKKTSIFERGRICQIKSFLLNNVNRMRQLHNFETISRCASAQQGYCCLIAVRSFLILLYN